MLLLRPRLQIEAASLIHARDGHGARTGAQVKISVVGHPQHVSRELFAREVDLDQPSGLRVGERCEQVTVQETERRRVGADAKSQRENRRDRKAWTTKQALRLPRDSTQEIVPDHPVHTHLLMICEGLARVARSAGNSAAMSTAAPTSATLRAYARGSRVPTP